MIERKTFMSKTLVTFFSADLFEIAPKKPYSKADLKAWVESL